MGLRSWKETSVHVHLFIYSCSKNDEKMILCARVYRNCHSICWITHPRRCFIAFKMKSYYPVRSHFQFSGWDGSGTGIPSDPGREIKDFLPGEQVEYSEPKELDKAWGRKRNVHLLHSRPVLCRRAQDNTHPPWGWIQQYNYRVVSRRFSIDWIFFLFLCPSIGWKYICKYMKNKNLWKNMIVNYCYHRQVI